MRYVLVIWRHTWGVKLTLHEQHENKLSIFFAKNLNTTRYNKHTQELYRTTRTYIDEWQVTVIKFGRIFSFFARHLQLLRQLRHLWYLRLFVAICDDLRPCVTILDRLRPFATNFKRLRLFATVSDRAWPFPTVCDFLRRLATDCNRLRHLRPFATICDHLRPFATGCNRLR